MSPADDFGTYRNRAETRLLHQVYAFAGDVEVAERALADAFRTARRRWRTVSQEPDPDAWMRTQAFAASTSPRNRSRQPWYVSARRTADENRSTLTALASLSPADRHVVIAHHLAGLDPAAAANEAGLTPGEAERALRSADDAWTGAGMEAGPAAIAAHLQRLAGDVVTEPVDEVEPEPVAVALPVERRFPRPSLPAVLVVAATAVVVAASGWVVLESRSSTAEPPQAAASSSTEPSVQPTADPPSDAVTVASLTKAEELRRLNPAESWLQADTTADLSNQRQVDDCLRVQPSDLAPPAHSWTRTFTSGRGDTPRRASLTLEVGRSPEVASDLYSQHVEDFATCPTGLDRVAEYRRIDDIGDSAAVFTLTSVVAGDIQTRHAAVARSGLAVVLWVVADSPGHEVSRETAVKMLGKTIGSVCDDASGRCSAPPYRTPGAPPPPAGAEPGFLALVDLPLFPTVSKPWVATEPGPVDGNPAATACDRADFAAAGADDVRAGAYVVPDAERLTAVFGISQTVGTFSTPTRAQELVASVAQDVTTCPQRETTATIVRSAQLDTAGASGRLWQIELATSAQATVVFRTAVVRVGDLVTQLTFTPAAGVDLTQQEFADIAARAGQRLAQS